MPAIAGLSSTALGTVQTRILIAMDKKALTEADIRTKFITPAIAGEGGSKWNVMTQMLEERYFTKGRVIVRGKATTRGEAKKADYILFYSKRSRGARGGVSPGPVRWEE